MTATPLIFVQCRERLMKTKHISRPGGIKTNGDRRTIQEAENKEIFRRRTSLAYR